MSEAKFVVALTVIEWLYDDYSSRQEPVLELGREVLETIAAGKTFTMTRDDIEAGYVRHDQIKPIKGFEKEYEELFSNGDGTYGVDVFDVDMSDEEFIWEDEIDSKLVNHDAFEELVRREKVYE